MALYRTPDLDARDLAVLGAIEQHRVRLRHFLSAPRRWKGQLRRNLRARAMRGSNSIEGYDVSLDDAIALLEGEEPLDTDQRTVLEVTGYRNAMTYIQQLSADPDFHLDESLLRSLHFMMLGHDLTKSPGQYRRAAIYVRDEDAGEIVYEGPDFGSVQPLMSELVAGLEQLDDVPGESPILVTAAMAHLNLVMVHPFRDGNGRMARCLQTMILARNQILEPEFSSIEEWLGRNIADYYQVLADVGRGAWHPEYDAHEWVKFNLRAHYIQAQTVLQRVTVAEEVWKRLLEVASRERLPERAVMALYNAALGLKVRRPVYEVDADLETGTANRDLKLMVQAGLLDAHGETRGRYYVGTRPLRQLYAEERAAVGRRIVEPYDTVDADLSPPPRKRMTTVG